MEFAFPAGDDGGGQAVADYVHGGTAHVHQRIDAEDHQDGGGGNVKRGSRRQQNHQGGARNAGDSLAGEHERGQHDDLLTERKMDAGGLGGEDGGHGEVDAAAGHVEAVAGGDDEGDDPARAAELLHVFHGEGQRG